MPLPNYLDLGAIVLASVGLTEDGHGDLSDDRRQEIGAIAEDLHRRARWASPPNIYQLAALADVRLFELPPDSVTIFAAGEASYPAHPCSAARLLLAAHALAGACLLREGASFGFVEAWTLAAELLAPAWVDRAKLAEIAPPWLVGLRRQAARTAGIAS